jgi:hypothetical protein
MGRDAHGLPAERVERRFAFEILPGLIDGAIREAIQRHDAGRMMGETRG